MEILTSILTAFLTSILTALLLAWWHDCRGERKAARDARKILFARTAAHAGQLATADVQIELLQRSVAALVERVLPHPAPTPPPGATPPPLPPGWDVAPDRRLRDRRREEPTPKTVEPARAPRELTPEAEDIRPTTIDPAPEMDVHAPSDPDDAGADDETRVMSRPAGLFEAYKPPTPEE